MLELEPVDAKARDLMQLLGVIVFRAGGVMTIDPADVVSMREAGPHDLVIGIDGETDALKIKVVPAAPRTVYGGGSAGGFGSN